jgi:hypothetical protein
MKQKKGCNFSQSLLLLLRRPDSNERPLGYEPNELPLLHSAIFVGAKVEFFFERSKFNVEFIC